MFNFFHRIDGFRHQVTIFDILCTSSKKEISYVIFNKADNSSEAMASPLSERGNLGER